MAGKKLFESGVSIGNGLTSELGREIVGERCYLDTPGVADATYRQEAGTALSFVFRQGGKMKILFFVTQKDGRIKAEDTATMK